MKRTITQLSIAFFLVTGLFACKSRPAIHQEENDKYDRPDLLMQYEFDRVKDPVTGRVEREKLWPAIEYTEQLKQDMRGQMSYSKATLAGWVERGPNSDTVGPGNGN